MEKARTINELDRAVQFNQPIGPDHPFFTDFTGLRGTFRDNRLYKALNIDIRNKTYDYIANLNNRTLVFLAGMRGSGKTTELARYAKEIDKPDAYFVVTCNIDRDLDMNHVEYMDILIFQLEKLVEKATEKNLDIDEKIVKSLQKWFEERVIEINRNLSAEASIEAGIKGSYGLPWILKLFGELKGGFTGSYERANTVRQIFKNRFGDFALKFNEFIAETAIKLRKSNLGQEVLFIIDGLEKTQTAETRRKIIIEDANRIINIRANTLFTLPIELMPDIRNIQDFANVLPFPFIKIRERNGDYIEPPIQKFIEFIYSRIDPGLFESEAVPRKAVEFSGGSPRELLRLLQQTGFEMEDNEDKITMRALLEAVKFLSSSAAYLDEDELKILKTIKQNNENAKSTPYLEGMQKLLESIVVMEYNDGNYKRVNPIIEQSDIYRQYVL
jgi:hypothetical protein